MARIARPNRTGVLTEEDRQMLIDQVVTPKDRMVIFWFLFTPILYKDLIQVTWGQLIGDEGVRDVVSLYFSVVGGYRDIPLPERLKEAIGDFYFGQEFEKEVLLVKYKRKRYVDTEKIITREGVRKIIMKWFKGLGISHKEGLTSVLRKTYVRFYFNDYPGSPYDALVATSNMLRYVNAGSMVGVLDLDHILPGLTYEKNRIDLSHPVLMGLIRFLRKVNRLEAIFPMDILEGFLNANMNLGPGGARDLAEIIAKENRLWESKK